MAIVMTRLFDATKERTAEDEGRRAQVEARARAEEAERAVAEFEELDEESQRLRGQLGKAMSEVTPIRYEEFRLPGSKWHIEHAKIGDDHVYQMFPLKAPSYPWQDIITMIIGAMDVIFPPSIHIHYTPPAEGEFRPFYTIRVADVEKTPGWTELVKGRVLQALCSVPAWEKNTPTPNRRRA